MGIEGCLFILVELSQIKNMNIKFIEDAIRLSRESVQTGGGPFGAVVIHNGEIIGMGMNRVVPFNDPTAHAEIVAIRNACLKTGKHELFNSEIYTSCEPCPMCLGAIYWSGIKKIYYANDRNDAENIGFSDNFIYEEISKEKKDRKIEIIKIENIEAKKVFEEWKEKVDKIMY